MTRSQNSASIRHTRPITELVQGRRFVEEFFAALRRGFLEEKFFYWMPPSVEAWVSLCRSSEYRNANRALALITRVAPRLADLWARAGKLSSLGCGEGSKDVPLLQAYAAQDSRLFFIGADFSRPLLELALQAADPWARAVRGFTADLLDNTQLAAVTRAASSGPPAIYAVLGNTLGALGPQTFPARLRWLLRTEDRVIFDGELWAGEETLGGYDNPTNRRFAFAPLAALGITEDDGDLCFELRAGKDGLHEVAKYFVPARDRAVGIEGQVIRFRAAEKLPMSSSIKYDESRLLALITEAGFRIELCERSDDGRFLLLAAAPAS